MHEDAADNLARNLRQLREQREITQAQLAQVSSVPRATIATLEAGGANPTLSVVLKLATALGVTLDELIAPPRAGARLYRADALPGRTRGGVSVRQLLPDPIPHLAIERLEFPVGGRLVGVPHTAGTREYLTSESGTVELIAGGEHWRLSEGDVVVFRGDQKHSYVNVGETPAVAYSVIVTLPDPRD